MSPTILPMGEPAALALSPPVLRDAALWRSIAPELHVGDQAFLQSQSPMALPAGLVEMVREQVRREGYFHLPPQQWSLPVDTLAQVIWRLDQLHIPLAFCFVYDEIWLMFFRMHRLLEGLLGKGYLRLPNFWAWLIDPQRQGAGWEPHRDRNYKTLFPDGMPRSMSIWIPLTDATPLNGCMYVVPADRDPNYGIVGDHESRHRLADIRALPAQAGSVLGWTQALLHWGANSSPRETTPRISVSVEFQAATTPPLDQPLTHPWDFPVLDFRLRLIGQQLQKYRHMHPLTPALEQLAVELQAP